MIKKRLKIVLSIISIFVISTAFVFNSFASVPSITANNNITPFQVTLGGYYYYADDADNIIPFKCDFPDIQYSDNYDTTKYSKSYIKYDDGYGDVTLYLDLDSSSLTSDSDSTMSTTSMQYSLSMSDYQGDSHYFTDTLRYHLTNCYIDADFALRQRHDGTNFSFEFPDLYYDYVSVRGQFYIPGVSGGFSTSYSTMYSQLNYYDILIHSNIDWHDYLPADIEYDVFMNHLASLQEIDWTTTDSETIDFAYNLLSHIGPLYGQYTLDVTNSEYIDGSGFTLLMNVLNVNQNKLDDFYEINVESSAMSGLTWIERTTGFIGVALSGFFDVEIMPDFSLGSIIVVLITFSIVLWWLKVFAGG